MSNYSFKQDRKHISATKYYTFVFFLMNYCDVFPQKLKKSEVWRLGTTELDPMKQKLSKAIVELYIVLVKTSQLIGEEERLQHVMFIYFLFRDVNSAACELEHLLLLITPELIFLLSPLSSSRLPSIQTYLTLLLLPRIFAVTVIPTVRPRLGPPPPPPPHYRRE